MSDDDVKPTFWVVGNGELSEVTEHVRALEARARKAEAERDEAIEWGAALLQCQAFEHVDAMHRQLGWVLEEAHARGFLDHVEPCERERQVCEVLDHAEARDEAIGELRQANKDLREALDGLRDLRAAVERFVRVAEGQDGFGWHEVERLKAALEGREPSAQGLVRMTPIPSIKPPPPGGSSASFLVEVRTPLSGNAGGTDDGTCPSCGAILGHLAQCGLKAMSERK